MCLCGYVPRRLQRASRQRVVIPIHRRAEKGVFLWDSLGTALQRSHLVGAVFFFYERASSRSLTVSRSALTCRFSTLSKIGSAILKKPPGSPCATRLKRVPPDTSLKV